MVWFFLLYFFFSFLNIIDFSVFSLTPILYPILDGHGQFIIKPKKKGGSHVQPMSKRVQLAIQME